MDSACTAWRDESRRDALRSGAVLLLERVYRCTPCRWYDRTESLRGDRKWFPSRFALFQVHCDRCMHLRLKSNTVES